MSPETSYTVYVRARDAAGNVSAASLGSFTTSGGGVGECAVDYAAGSWIEQPGAGGFTAHITVTNTGDESVNGWTLQFTLPAGKSLDHGWSATWPPPGSTGVIIASDLGWNATLAAGGGSTTIGFNGRWTGAYTYPTGFTLNGVTCTLT